MSVICSEEHIVIILSLELSFALGSLFHPTRPDLAFSSLVGGNGREHSSSFVTLAFSMSVVDSGNFNTSLY